MPPWLQPLADLVGEATGWTLFVLAVVAVGFALWKGHLVPGWAYRAAVARYERAEAKLEDANAQDAAAAAAAAVAERAALTVLAGVGQIERLQQLGRRDPERSPDELD